MIQGFHVVQNKGGAVVRVPCSRRLRDAFAGISSDPGFLVVNETTGKPYRKYTFVHRFAEIRDKAGIIGLRYQDLRRTCVVNLAHAGCTRRRLPR
ncbi:MAG: putative phage integrase family protein [Tardiphaga sp.]|nr:putative phage integrase family protein [Tardiphaga sp.]